MQTTGIQRYRYVRYNIYILEHKIKVYNLNSERGIPTLSLFDPGSGPIHLSRAQCGNDDTILTDCEIDKTGVNNCKHNEDAGVICMGIISSHMLCTSMKGMISPIR